MKTVWMTGLSGAGKTTLASEVRRELALRGLAACVIDGDELRAGLSGDLGLSRRDRAEQARRAAHVAALIAREQIVAIVALVSPYADDRRLAREIHHSRGLEFVEVWVDTPLAICERRDTKGLYSRARDGELTGLTGVDDPYEAPRSPELRLRGYGRDPAVGARQIVRLVLQVSPAGAMGALAGIGPGASPC